MKIIEALKKKEMLYKKAQDIAEKILANKSHYTIIEKPAYDNQQEKIDCWLQAHRDLLKEISDLSLAIQKTNISTDVTIEICGKQITKKIAEWLVRKGVGRNQSLLEMEKALWNKMTENRPAKQPVNMNTEEGKDVVMSELVLYYKPEDRDEKLVAMMEEPSLIDSALEIANATTDLVE